MLGAAGEDFSCLGRRVELPVNDIASGRVGAVVDTAAGTRHHPFLLPVLPFLVQAVEFGRLVFGYLLEVVLPVVERPQEAHFLKNLRPPVLCLTFPALADEIEPSDLFLVALQTE